MKLKPNMKFRLAGQRGYTSFGKEHAKGKTGDLKEFFILGKTILLQMEKIIQKRAG